MRTTWREKIVYRMAIAGFLVGGVAAGAAHADIVYTLPPQPISASGEGFFVDVSAPLDVDNDGVPEFALHAFRESLNPGGWPSFTTTATYLQTARAGVYVRGLGDLEILEAGSIIGPPDIYAFAERANMNFHYPSGPGGDSIMEGVWVYDAPPAYFGFEFDIGGQPHYGWARAQIVRLGFTGFGVFVFDYAYESTGGVPIPAGQAPAPGAAVVLGIGAVAVTGRRRRGAAGRAEAP